MIVFCSVMTRCVGRPGATSSSLLPPATAAAAHAGIMLHNMVRQPTMTNAGRGCFIIKGDQPRLFLCACWSRKVRSSRAHKRVKIQRGLTGPMPQPNQMSRSRQTTKLETVGWPRLDTQQTGCMPTLCDAGHKDRAEGRIRLCNLQHRDVSRSILAMAITKTVDMEAREEGNVGSTPPRRGRGRIRIWWARCKSCKSCV